METRSFFAALKLQPPDSLLKLIGDFAADPRPGKIDLGVGVYRDTAGGTPIPAAVKEAEKRLLQTQVSKAYLGPEGSAGFNTALKNLVWGDTDGICVQTPGGTGALRLGFDVLARAKPDARIWVGNPTWPNHPALIAAAGLEIATYTHFDQKTQTLRFDEVMAALKAASSGDVVLLHGCCHNPTGADFSLAEWEEIADVMARRGLLPFIDLAYQGLGDGFEADSAGARTVIARCGEGFVAYSCDKNFALYRERTGALMVFTREDDTRKTVLSNVLSSARANWSMPPDHGAAIVETVLNDEPLKASWLAELEAMRTRIAKMRHMLAAADADFTAIGVQRGLFSLLPVLPNGVAFLKEQHGIYFPASGRVNVAGFTEENLPVFVKAWGDLKSRHPDFLYPLSPSTSRSW